MANRLTVQESINPYTKGTVKQSSSIPSRAIVNNGSSAAITLTFEDGTTAALWMAQGTLYPIACIGSSADVLFLY